MPTDPAQPPAPTPQITPQQPPVTQSPTTPPTTPPTNKITKLRPLITVILVLIALIILTAVTLYVYFQFNQSRELATTPTPTTQPTPNSTQTPSPTLKSDTSDWQTYTNREWGITFKYPANFTESGVVGATFLGNPQFVLSLANESTMLKETDATYDGFSVYLIANPEHLELKTFIENEIQTRKESPRGIDDTTIKEITFRDNQFLYFGAEDAIQHYFIQAPNGQIILFAVVYKTQEYTDVFNQILSTFELIDQPTTPQTLPDLNDQICGGIAAIACPSGYVCQLDGNYPDASGTCIRSN